MAIRTEGWKLGGGIVLGVGIPAPSGQYRVGCVDLMHRLKRDDKGLLLRLHYPTDATPEAGYTYSPWSPHKRYIKGYLDFEKVIYSGFLASLVNTFCAPKMPSLEGAPLLKTSGKPVGANETHLIFPVIVLSHGLGAMRTSYSGIACDLASHGYVVACVEHRDESACVSHQRISNVGGKDSDRWIKFYHLHRSEKKFPLRNRQVKIRSDDVKKSLDILGLLNEGEEVCNMIEGSKYDFKQFKGSMDVSTAAVIGHSFGGATTIQTLSEDTRFKCGVAMDCWMLPLHRDLYKDNISQPLYFINSYSFQWKENVQKMMSLTKPPDASGRTPCRVLTINGTNHYSQSDVPYLFPPILNRLVVGFKDSALDCVEAHRLNMEVCHDFLKRHLLEDPAYQKSIPNLDGSEGHSEHLIFGTNVDLSADAQKPENEDVESDSSADQNEDSKEKQMEETVEDNFDEGDKRRLMKGTGEC